MLYGISATAVPSHLPYAEPIQRGCVAANFFPCFLYAVAQRETIRGEKNGSWPSAVKVIAGDGGRGLLQLTSSYPSDWDDIDANIRYALAHFLIPSLHFFAGRGLRSEALVRTTAAAFNEGQGTAWLDHLAGDVDLGTTGHDYAEDVFTNYSRLTSGQDPL